jgi:hypothetical protein
MSEAVIIIVGSLCMVVVLAFLMAIMSLLGSLIKYIDSLTEGQHLKNKLTRYKEGIN